VGAHFNKIVVDKFCEFGWIFDCNLSNTSIGSRSGLALKRYGGMPFLGTNGAIDDRSTMQIQ